MKPKAKSDVHPPCNYYEASLFLNRTSLLDPIVFDCSLLIVRRLLIFGQHSFLNVNIYSKLEFTVVRKGGFGPIPVKAVNTKSTIPPSCLLCQLAVSV